MQQDFNIQEFERYGATSFQLLNFFEVKRVLEEVRSHEFKPAPLEHGAGKVMQEFERASLVRSCAPRTMRAILLVEQYLRSVILGIPKEFTFNEYVIQRYYSPRNIGIGPHRDESVFEYVVASLVLEDGGKFFVSDDKALTNIKHIDATIGSCIVMKGSIPGQKVIRPIHYVSDVWRERITIGLRFSQTPQVSF